MDVSARTPRLHHCRWKNTPYTCSLNRVLAANTVANSAMRVFLKLSGERRPSVDHDAILERRLPLL